MSQESKQDPPDQAESKQNEGMEIQEIATSLLTHYDEDIVSKFAAHCDDDGYDFEALKEDTEGDIEDSFIAEHMQKEIFEEDDNNKAKTIRFIEILREIINPKQQSLPQNNQSQKPSTKHFEEVEEKLDSNKEISINWNCINKNNKDKEMKESNDYLHKQLRNCADIQKPLIQLYTIGRLNNKEYLPSLINDIYSLSDVEYKDNGNENLFNLSMWTKEYSPYFVKYKQCELIQNALTTYSNRIMHSHITTAAALLPFNDFVMDYIKYTLLVNNAISNILSSIEYSQKVCPLQIDLVIYGRNYKTQKDDDYTANSDDNWDNDEELNLFLQESLSRPPAQMNSPVPDFKRLFQKFNIDVKEDKINITNQDLYHQKRKIQNPIMKFLGSGKRNQRIIVLVDRTNGKKQNDLDKERDIEDTIYVYQIPNYDDIPKDYMDETLHWRTKEALIPSMDYDRMKRKFSGHNDDKNGLFRKYLGCYDTLSDRNFIVSYHCHSEDNIKMVQYIKRYSLILLPYHCTTLWPKYFKNNGIFNKIDDKYTKDPKLIYEKWSLPVHTKRIMQYIRFIDPKLYEILNKKHVKNIHEPNYLQVIT